MYKAIHNRQLFFVLFYAHSFIMSHLSFTIMKFKGDYPLSEKKICQLYTHNINKLFTIFLFITYYN